MKRLVGGLMSGTSLDGIDAILLEVEGEDPLSLGWKVVRFASTPWSPEMRHRMRGAMAPGGTDAAGLAKLHVELGEALGEAFSALLTEARVDPAQVEAVGSHGQTLWHEPPRGGRGHTLQLGDPATLAEVTGVPVVSDFRARDMAAGGEGAPLVPWADRVLLHRPGVGRALQNLGGMGNVTFLPRSGALEGVQAFDTGPGVALLDGAALRASEGAEPWDLDGRRARKGTVQAPLLEALLADPFFQRPPPKSTGRERFGEARLEALVAEFRNGGPLSEADWNDLLATLTELTAQSVARSYRDFLPAQEIDEVVLAGGGARNPALAQALVRALHPLPVRTGSEALGVDPDAREAAAFALLAWAHLRKVPGSLPLVTGARGARVLGSLTPRTPQTS